MRSFVSVRIGLLALGSVLLLGCPASQTWTTARTVPAGTAQHTVGVEFVGMTWDCPEGTEGESCVEPIGFIAVPFPAYVARIGVADMLDIGFKASSSGSFGADLKIQLVRTSVFDFALDPGITGTFGFTYVNLPVLFSLNLGDMLTFTIYPKVSYWKVFQDEVDSAVDGFFVGGGGNLQIRIGDRFAIAPGIEWARSVEEYVDQGTVTFLNFGIGFSFGSFPEYGEPVVMQPEPAAAQPAAQPAAEPAPQPAATVIVQ